MQIEKIALLDDEQVEAVKDAIDTAIANIHAHPAVAATFGTNTITPVMNALRAIKNAVYAE